MSEKTATARAFENVVWPAVAGNVAWSFFTLAIDPSVARDATLFARAASLILLSLYAVLDWVRITSQVQHRTSKYWVFDGLHLVSLTTFAMAAATGRSVAWLTVALSAFFFITAVGHVMQVFRYQHPFVYGGINVIGLVLAAALWPAFRDSGWHLTIGIGAALALWLGAAGILDRPG